MKGYAAIALLIAAALAAPALAQGLPTVSDAELATAQTAVEAAALDREVYRQLWCGGTFSLMGYMQTTASETAAAAESNAARDRLYAKAATALLTSGVTEQDFTALGENVYLIAVYQALHSAETSPDFTVDQCKAAAE